MDPSYLLHLFPHTNIHICTFFVIGIFCLVIGAGLVLNPGSQSAVGDIKDNFFLYVAIS